VHGSWLGRSEVERQITWYGGVPLAERLRIPGLAAGRAEVIFAGAVIVDRVLARAGAARFRVSDRGVRWGLAAEVAGDR
jgi:exopolyphosphatase/guanosine-5'-triphosphate,3'-diphosphate pyrophosphatase